MLGGRTRAAPVNQVPDAYSARLAASESVYNADLVPPATSYATTRSSLSAGYVEPTVKPKTGAFFGSYAWRLNGMRNFWSWGGIDMKPYTVSTPGVNSGLNGFVRSTDFQTVLVRLHDWQTNTAWFQAGWNGTGGGMFTGSKPVRYDYPSFRVEQIHTSVTGGPGSPSMRMNRSPRFTSVQSIQKYTTTPTRYKTKGTLR